MTRWWVHRRWESRLAQQLNMSPRAATYVDTLIDHPKRFMYRYYDEESSTLLGRHWTSIGECVERRLGDPRAAGGILAALRHGMIEHDWNTQRTSPKRRKTSASMLRMLRAVADCTIEPEASLLAELHVALDLISKLELYQYTANKALQELNHLELSQTTQDFIKNNWNIISKDVEKAKT